MKRFEEIDHTADAALRIFGADLPALFANAALGLFSLMFDPMPAGGVAGEGKLQLTARDREALLRLWLQELLFRFEVHGEVPTEVCFDDLTDSTLRATVKHVRFDPESMEVLRQIKAVTYHDLTLTQAEDHLEATVVLDT